MDSRKFGFVTLALFVSTTAGAQKNSDQDLSELREIGGGFGWQIVEQAGSHADQIRKNLERFELPTGFTIRLFAVAPNATHIAVSPQGVVVFTGTRASAVWAITDRDKDRIADEVKRFAGGVSFKNPSGVCFSKDGFLYVVEQNRVLMFPAAEYTYESFGVPVAEIVSQLVPAHGELPNSASRACDIGPDDKLYVWLGHPAGPDLSNYASSVKHSESGDVIRINRDGSDPEMLQNDDLTRSHIGPRMLIYTGTMFPERYRGGVFSIQQSAQLMFTMLKEDGSLGVAELFGGDRPIISSKTFGGLTDIAQMHDGSILLSDELAGAIYRLSYDE